MKCKDCKFWDGFWIPKKGDEDYSEFQVQTGKCRKDSPRFITGQLLVIPGEECSNAEDICFQGEWPTSLEYDWCGEFEVKE